MRINWVSIIVTGISRTTITMPDIAYVSIFKDNDLTHITVQGPFSCIYVRYLFLAIVPKVLISSRVVHKYTSCDFGECCESVP